MDRSEFIEYVKNLELYDLEVITDFVLEYYDHYNAIPEENEKEKQDAWEKYVIVISKYGIMMAEYTRMMIGFRKTLEDLKKEFDNEDRESGSVVH